ncbi:hypothetical protein [uncultured Brevundimonas sp.]|uniref:hypothetical protein n=1 Tax=uncultured Brevundimonas sp. TaxID=213418 RepID=UPI0025E57217|nr:hypothetical protein [uncultured Brevundimonas sp.]
MSKYYNLIIEKTELNRRSGADSVVPFGFHELSVSVISQCSFLQSLMQQVIYITHGAEISAAKKALREFPSPKARMEFLCSFPYSEEDLVVSKVFEYARNLFHDLYELRNTLSHEVWSSSDDYDGCVLFSSLDEDARLLLVSGRIWHKEDATPLEVYNATIRYIRSVKIVSCVDLHLAMKDANLCAWILMNICNVLNEKDFEQKEKARRAFLVFQGTAHLFGDVVTTPETITFQSSRKKTIRG